MNKRRYKFMLTALILAWVLAAAVLYLESEYIQTAITAFGSVASLGAAGAGAEGVARNWAAHREPDDE